MEYLNNIVADVRRRVEERKERLPLHEVRNQAGPERPSFAAAVREPGLSLIAEVKRASPSKGPLRPGLDVANLVERYEKAGARAISVLTEEDHFRGSLVDLRQAASATALPLLQKDFILDEYQLHEARANGASAVLLIVAILGREEFLALGETAHRLGLDVLAEVHADDELPRVLALERAIIGINNRDLRTFAVSLETTFRLISRVPAERTVVSESGIAGHEDFVRLEAAGVDGILVGEHLLRSEDVEATIQELLGR